MLADYRWTLTEETHGSVTLEIDPINWASLVFTIKRSEEYKGISRNFSTEAEFARKADEINGYDFIKSVYDEKGVNAEIVVDVEILNRTTMGYEALFTGKINLNNYNIIQGELGLLSISTNIEETGFERQFVDNLSTEVNLFNLLTKSGDPITASIPDFATIFFRSYPIQRAYSATNSGNPLANLSYLYGQKVFDGEFRYFYIYPANDVSVQTVKDTFEYAASIWTEPPENYNLFFLDVKEDGDYDLNLQGNIDVSLEIEPQGAAGDDDLTRLTVTGIVAKADGTILDQTVLLNVTQGSGQTLSGTNLNYSYSVVGLALEVGEKLFFYAEITGETVASGGAGLNDKVRWVQFDVLLNSVQYDITGITNFPITATPAKYVKDAFERIVNIVTDEPDKIVSNFLDTEDAGNDVITSGYIIRGADPEEQPIRCNFLALWKSLWMKYNIGFGVLNDQVVIEPIAFFYQEDLAFVVEELKDFNLRAANELYYSQITIGYEKWQIDEDSSLTGALEYNGKRTYQTPVRYTENQLEILSPYVSALYAIENIRRIRVDNIEEAESTRYDEDNFLVRTINLGIPTSAGTEYLDAVTGVPNANLAYNLDHLPTRALYQHLNTIAHTFYKINNGVVALQFTAREGTPNGISTEDDGITVFEDQDITQADQPLWTPEIATFNAPLTFSQFQSINSNPYRLIEFTDPSEGTQRQGWILSLNYRYEERQADYELIIKGEVLPVDD